MCEQPSIKRYSFKVFWRSYHPDPGSIENVQVWETGASAYWRFFEGFFWYQRFHRRSKKSQTLGASEILLLCSKLNQADALRFVKNHRRRSEICEIISKHLKSSLIYQKWQSINWFISMSNQWDLKTLENLCDPIYTCTTRKVSINLIFTSFVIIVIAAYGIGTLSIVLNS